MKGRTIETKPSGNVFLLMLVAVFLSGIALAQVPVDENGNPIPVYEGDESIVNDADEHPLNESPLSAAELEELVGPVALYPDDLLAIVLPASTYPLEIVQAARFLEQLETDSSLKPDEDWDESIVALLNYPDVVRMLDEEIDWTWRLGEAVISQQSELIAAVESFRDRAYAAGNLKSDEYQTVSNDEGVIEIEPADEEIIYVPYYEPEEVVVYQPRRVYNYYPDPCPVYYYPYPAGYRFRSGLFWGVTTAFNIGWSNHYLHVYHPSYWGHPYYGRSYYGHYYRRPSINVYNNWYVNNSYRSARYRYRDGDYWRPRVRAGSRPNESRVRNYHYPPGSRSDSRDDNRRDRNGNRRSTQSVARVRNNGRMDLNLRERSNTRSQTSNQRQARIGGIDRTSVANRSSTRTDRARDRAQVDGRNQTRTTTENSRRGSASNRGTSGRSEIRFRNRDVNSGAASTRTGSRPSANRPSTASANAASNLRRTTASQQNRGRVVQTQRQPANRTTNRNSNYRGTAQPRLQRQPVRRPQAQSTQRVQRQTVSRTAPSVPRASSPTITRQSAPARRSSTPSFQRQAPAPRSAVIPTQRRAPSGASRSNDRGSSANQGRRSSTNQRRPSSSSRPRSSNQ